MPLYKERSNAHLTVATYCTVSISTCSNSKDANLGKLGPQNVIAAQKFLFEATGLSVRNVDRVICVAKLHAIDKCKYL